MWLSHCKVIAIISILQIRILRFREIKNLPRHSENLPGIKRQDSAVSCTRWGQTHLASQVPLGFGCQEGQGVKTQLKPFCFLVFPAALIQFLRGFRREGEWVFMWEGSHVRAFTLDSNDDSRKAILIITSFSESHRNHVVWIQPGLLPALRPLNT